MTEEKSVIEQQIAGMYNLGCATPTIRSAINDFRLIFASDPAELALLDDLEVRYITSHEVREEEGIHDKSGGC